MTGGGWLRSLAGTVEALAVACGDAGALLPNGNTDAARASGFRTHIGICNGMEAG